MIIRLAHTSDRQAWDQYVAGHTMGSPYHKYSWGQAVQKAYGHQAQYWLAEQEGQIVGVLPCVRLKRLLGGEKYCALPFCDVGGPLAQSHEIRQLLLDRAAAEGAVILESRDMGKQGEAKQYQGNKVSMRLPLPDSSEALLASFKSKLRSQVRKAEKNGLRYETGRSEQLLQHFYEVMLVNMRALGSPVHSYKWFREIIEQYGEQCLVGVVYLDQIPAGAGIILINGEKASIPWASTKSEFNRLAPNMLLYWALLAYCAEHRITEFDFGRSTYGEGTYKFKSQWGAQPWPLNWQTYQNGQLLKTSDTDTHASTSRLKGTMKQWVIRLWRTMPLSWTAKLGPLLRKQIDL
ncbi:GNAT family N-acetyltransferase [Neiella marina]|uniref:GNAT family N-acetyltransferase n=1 Tax=Neiella holothuriorum TaxID=2870530 RepID=A0ABS7EGY6_9GAMM|nr:GNAT family N-acetyltransferase [Neiella holothuriorum]MBW8191619.1 GNAT family N-acetyltransferase [Neiella holothuriorum]